jgi:glutamine amidotransferase
VYNAFQLLGQQVEITNDPISIKKSDAIILPGVGAFSDGIENLKKTGIYNILQHEVLINKKPYLGICLGLEFLAEKSYEGGTHNGFGWIKGNVIKIEPNDPKLKVPHMGWDDTTVKNDQSILKELKDPSFYFLHSYHFQVAESEKDCVTSTCDYGGIPLVATVQKENIHAVQFHPEKSQENGLMLLKNFLDFVRK